MGAVKAEVGATDSHAQEISQAHLFNALRLSPPPRQRLVIRMLGTLEVASINDEGNESNDEGVLSSLGTSKPLADITGRLLAALVLYSTQPGRGVGCCVTRQKLAGLLFPDQTDVQARRMLTDGLYRLRRELAYATSEALAQIALIGDAESIQLSTNPNHIWIDVVAFKQGAQAKSVAAWQQAIALYRGDLFENSDAEWLEATRTTLREDYLNLLEKTCATLADTEQFSEALSVARAWAQADPLREDAHVATMRLCAHLGRHAHALQHYAHYKRLLAEEMQIEPSATACALANELHTQARAQSISYVSPLAAADFRTVPCNGFEHAAARARVRQHRQAGDQAETSYEHALALEHYQCALDMLDHFHPNGAQLDRLALLCRRQRVYGMLMQFDDWQMDIEKIERLAEELHIPVALLTTLEARISLCVIASDPGGMRDAGERALALARSTHNVAAEARIANVFGKQLCFLMGQTASAIPLLQSALRNAIAINNTALHVSVLCNLSIAQRLGGQSLAARESALRALTLSQLTPQHYAARADALHALGCAEVYLGEWPTAHQTLNAAMQAHASLHNMWALAETTLQWCLLNSQMGQHANALAAAEHLLAICRNVGLAAESDLFKWAEAVKLDVLVLSGDARDFEAARPVLSNLLAWLDKPQSTALGPLLQALQAVGRFYLAQQKPERALPFLTRARGLFEKQQMVQVEVLLLHAQAAHRTGDTPDAQVSLHGVEQRLKACEVIPAQVEARRHFVRYEVTGDGNALCAAYEALQTLSRKFDNETERQSLLQQVGLHREIQSSWQRERERLLPATGCNETDRPHCISVTLARAEATLGGTDRLQVCWTLDDGETDAIALKRLGKVGLRRIRLQRLLREACEQGAVPTDMTLASALNVNVRTIERDMAALKSLSVATPTRRRH